MVEIYGFVSVCLMVTFYALEKRNPVFVLAFGLSCILASSYALLINSLPFALVEFIWGLIAIWKWANLTNRVGG